METDELKQVLYALNIATACEAWAAVRAFGLDPVLVEKVIHNSAGMSIAFETLHEMDESVDNFWKSLKLSSTVPLFMLNAASSLFEMAKKNNVKIKDIPEMLIRGKEPLTSTFSPPTLSRHPTTIGVIGMGEMGFGMAKSLLKKHSVYGCDHHQGIMSRWKSLGGYSASLQEALNQPIVVLVVNTFDQILSILSNNVQHLYPKSVVIICSTVPPRQIATLPERFPMIDIVDAPISGGPVRANLGTLSIMASGTDEALTKAWDPLSLMASDGKTLYAVGGGVGMASRMKAINQILAANHITSCAQVLALSGDRVGLWKAVKGHVSDNFVWNDRGLRMIERDFDPAKSILQTMIKDLGIVLEECKNSGFPTTWLTNTSLQLFQMAKEQGLGMDDDAGVIRLWETPNVNLLTNHLPNVDDKVWNDILTRLDKAPCLVVLDDDPTGTQTVYDLPVLLAWDVKNGKPASPRMDRLKDLMKTRGFFILTNTRAMEPRQVDSLLNEIMENLKLAASKPFRVVLRGDSTLRGHYPLENQIVTKNLDKPTITILCPFFKAGKRVTIENIHYIRNGNDLSPVASSQFAKDPIFGYKNSNLKLWVEEKMGKPVSTVAISLTSLRLHPEVVQQQLSVAKPDDVVIVNAIDDLDVACFCLELLKVEEDRGVVFLPRTAAAFVSCRLGLKPKDVLQPQVGNGKGKLIVVGSHVPLTTLQVEYLQDRVKDLVMVEIDVEGISRGESGVKSLDIEEARVALDQDKTVMVMTSRRLIVKDFLQLGEKIRQTVCDTVSKIILDKNPKIVISKGGITSCDIPTRVFKVDEAKVLGQAYPGVPLWKIKDLNYVVFPGNVGEASSLHDVLMKV